MKERPAVGGRKPDPEPRENEEDREVFQSLESRGNWKPTEGPRTPELDHGTTSGRATDDQIERQKNAPTRLPAGEPATEVTRRHRRKTQASKQHPCG